MDISNENYPNNSDKKKDTEKEVTETKLKPVVTDGVSVRKKSRFLQLFDPKTNLNLGKAKDYIVKDLIIPSIARTISDIVKDGIDILIYGTAKRRDGYGVPASRISYSSFWNGGGEASYRPSRKEDDQLMYTLPGYDSIEFDRMEDAEEVLLRLKELIPIYGFAKVGDLYDFCGLSSECDYTMQRYGWTSLNTARVVPSRDKWRIRLPRATPIG